MKYHYYYLLLAPLFTVKATTYCNPMDIDYQYAEIPDKRKFFNAPNLLARGSADPVLINHQVDGKHQGYYLFSTTARGYWQSENLANWQHIIPTDKWPVSYFDSKKTGEYYKDMIAPAAYSLDNKLYLLASNRDIKTSIYVSDDPSSGKFKIAHDNLGFPNVGDGNLWDPGLFHENEQWYIFWGSSNVFPLFGTKLKKQKGKNKDNSLKLDRWLKSIINLYPEQHGWERFGRDHSSKTHPYIEGPELTKNNGKYYLQYSAPGTSENVYADGVYVADAPLGPYSYAQHNPMSYKPGGFVHGMGHGNTFQDSHGNYWHTGTSWLGVNWVFERRISLIPAGFDNDGNMYSSSRFADFPHHSPTKKWQSPEELFTGWMLLSYKKPSWSTSHLNAKYSSANITDENPRTFWVAENNNADQSVILDLEASYDIKAIQLNYADFMVTNTKLAAPLPKDGGLAQYQQDVYSHYKVSVSADNKNWLEVGNNLAKKENRSNPYIELTTPTQARFIRFENVHVATKNLALSEIRVFGLGTGEKPSTPSKISIKRDSLDQRNATISWQASTNKTTGYNINWGIAKDKLYHTYQIWADQPQEKEIRSLNIGQSYYFSIEAFNENGVSKMSQPIKID